MNRLFILLFIIGSSVSADSKVLLPLDDAEHTFVYTQIERNEFLNHQSYDYFNAPYFIPDSHIINYPYRFLKLESLEKVNLLFSANNRMFMNNKNKTVSYEQLKAKLFAQPFDNIYFYSSLSLDEKKAEDPSYTGKKWRGLAGGVEQSFAAYDSKSFTAIGGRFKSYWGIEKSLLLSAEQPLDGFTYSIRWKRLTISYQIAKLNQVNASLGLSLIHI